MKLSTICFRQHIGWYFKQHWKTQGRKKLVNTGAIKLLAEKGIPVYEPKDIIGEPEIELIEEISDCIPPVVKFDQTHPNWHDRICYTYRDKNVLLQGLEQAKIITNTIEPHEGLPSHIEIKKSSNEVDKKVKQIILSSHLFDAEQQKLPKRKDLERPAWNFPRDYGITERRVNKLIVTKLLQAIELWADPNIVKQRHILNDLQFWYPFEKEGQLFQFELTGDCLLTTLNPLGPITMESTENYDLPTIDPIKYTITLVPENIYTIQNKYPIGKSVPKYNPHTVFVHYNTTEVYNIFEEPVTEEQFLGRSLMKAFTLAASYAKEKFGDIKLLPNPVTVQCVHTDGRIFHFGIFQLNTLDTSSENKIKNVWYHTPRMALFDSCSYNVGRPTLEGYNNNVIRHLITFYDNK